MDANTVATNVAARLSAGADIVTGKITVACVDPAGLAPKILNSLFGGGSQIHCQYADLHSESGRAIAASCDVGVLVDPIVESSEHIEIWKSTLEHWRCLGLPAVLLGDQRLQTDCQFANVRLSWKSSPELLIGVVLGLAADEKEIRALEGQRQHAAMLSDSIGTYLAEVDSELRLATRLQKEFLPKSGLTIGPLTITTLFRPSNWVSGDIFDVFKIDDHQIGFYLADVMGHGVAAGLLTMYLKQLIRPPRSTLEIHDVLPPGEVMAAINAQICDLRLHDSQFVTGIFGVLHLETLKLDYAVAGHPPLIHVTRSGEMKELNAEGTILGLDTAQTYETCSMRLNQGDRLIVYSDGLEQVLIEERHQTPPEVVWSAGIPKVLNKSPESVLGELTERLDSLPGSLTKSDDASLMLIDVSR
jgi:serine phosphatase RsbU (regulator of sigma subunit)